MTCRGSSLTNKQCFKSQKVTEKERESKRETEREGSCLTDKLLFKIRELKTEMEERQSDIQREVTHLTYRQSGWSKPDNDSQSEKERKSQTAASYDTGLCDTTMAS